MSPTDEIAAHEMSAVAVPRLLYPLVRPAGRWPVPAAYETAAVADARARAAYEAGDYQQAATIFLAMAARLRLPVGEPYGDMLAANRRLVYANAVAALIMAGTIAEARSALGAAAAADPLCAEAIDRLLADLGASVEPSGSLALLIPINDQEGV